MNLLREATILKDHFTDKIINKDSLTKLCKDLLYQDLLESEAIWKKKSYVYQQEH